jgi:4-hydroxybenzoate polyprenyltransferase
LFTPDDSHEERRQKMNTWLVYQRERFPLIPNLLIAFGMASHGMVTASGGSSSKDNGILAGAPLLMGAFMTLLFFAVLRLMDEVKDVAKDRMAHPERPLARGLIPVDRARLVIAGGVVLMFAVAAIVSAFYDALPGALYAGTTVYLWLMYKEFYVGAWLGKWPLLYAATHQVILFPLVSSAAALAPSLAPGSLLILLISGAQIFPAFFAYEVARKIAPGAHPVLGTYRSVYGLSRCQMMLGGFFLLSLYAFTKAKDVFPYAQLSGVAMALLVATFAGAPLGLSLIKGDSGAREVEGLATLNLLFTMYLPFFGYLYIRVMGVAQ